MIGVRLSFSWPKAGRRVVWSVVERRRREDRDTCGKTQVLVTAVETI